MKSMYKEVDLFGNENIKLVDRKRQKKNLFSDHDAFVDKFKPKKTTDDCFTPKEVYLAVLEYVNEHCDITDRQIIRPFFPGGDFESIDYPEGCVVIDNPPFSIITKIARFYIKKNISFFLFAPHLTLFSGGLNCTHIVVGANIEYENKAVVKTSFLTNLFGGIGVIGDAELYQKLETLRKSLKVALPKYDYPNNVLTVSSVSYMVEKGISIRIHNKDLAHCRALDDQKKHDKTIFGSGFLLSEKAAAEKAAAEKAAAEKAAAEKVNLIEWRLSDNEMAIIKSLG